MAGENIEELWYGFWLIKAIVSLSVLLAVALLCKWVLRSIPWDRIKWRSTKHSMEHPLGTRQPPRNFNAWESRFVDRNPSERKKGIG